MDVVRTVWKAIGAAIGAGAGAAGIALADLPWPTMLGAAALAFITTFFAPANAPQPEVSEDA